MEELHEELSSLVSLNKLKYKYLGAVIDKTPDSFRMAYKRKSLTRIELKELITTIKKDYPVKETEQSVRLNVAGVNRKFGALL